MNNCKQLFCVHSYVVYDILRSNLQLCNSQKKYDLILSNLGETIVENVNVDIYHFKTNSGIINSRKKINMKYIKLFHLIKCISIESIYSLTPKYYSLYFRSNAFRTYSHYQTINLNKNDSNIRLLKKNRIL